MQRLFNIILFFVVAICPVFSQSTGIITIDLVNPHEEIIPMSRFFTNIEYVPLETNELCILKKKHSTYYLTDQYILGIDILRNAYLFDRKTGAFIKQISREGEREDEYRRYPIDQYGFDEKSNLLFFDDKDQWKGISIEADKKVIKVTKPQYSKKIEMPNKEVNTSAFSSNTTSQNLRQDWLLGTIHNPYPLGNNFIGFVNNTTGNINVKLVIFDKDGKVLQAFPNYQNYKKRTLTNPLFKGGFYNYDNKVYFKEINNDTVFVVHSDILEPHIIFNLGDNHIPYDAIENSIYDYYYNIQLVKETGLYIFFNYTIGPILDQILVSGYYDKKTEQTYICKAIDGKAGFINDIDGFPYFNPLLITNKNKFLGEIWPEDLLNWYNSNDKDKISSRGINIISRIKAEDNPIIVIADLIE